MKNIILFIAVIIGFILVSCGIVKNNDFTSRKYTKFHKGGVGVVSSPVLAKQENMGTAKGENTATHTEKTDKPVIISSGITKTVSDKLPAKILVSENLNSPSEKVTTEKKQNIRLKKIHNYLARRVANDANTASVNSDDTVLLVILAILVPPLAVYLARGIGTEFWISVILWFCLILPGIIYAILVVLDEI